MRPCHDTSTLGHCLAWSEGSVVLIIGQGRVLQTIHTCLCQSWITLLRGDFLVVASARTWLGRWPTRYGRRKKQIKKLKSIKHPDVPIKQIFNVDGWAARAMNPPKVIKTLCTTFLDGMTTLKLQERIETSTQT